MEPLSNPRIRRVGVVNLIEAQMAPGHVASNMRYPNASFQLLVSGRYIEEEVRRTPGTAHFHPAEDAMSSQCGDLPVRTFGVCMPPSKVDLAAELGKLPTEPCEFPQRPIVNILAHLHREFWRDDSASEVAIEGWCYELLARFAQAASDEQSPMAPRWLLRAHEMIVDDPTQPYSLGVIARECAVHPSHLARSYRRHFRLSIGERLRRERCRSAMGLVKETDLSLAEVALRCGFFDASHMARTVRATTGRPVGEYRARNLDIDGVRPA